MFNLSIRSSTRVYPIKIGLGLIEDLMRREFVAIVDNNLEDIINLSPNRVIKIHADETRKNLSTCESVLQQMKDLGCNRDTLIVAFGGGLVQDIATLASALYMRGLSWVYAPTTLMSMMDSCIGGKSSINVGTTKNLVGNFYPPTEIIIDLQFTKTLDASAIASGLLEGIKICYARGPEAFERFCNYREQIETYNSALAAELVAHVLESKKWFVEVDEFDMGPRKLLNFGHTFGHALESATDFAIPHGIAVGLGVIAALLHPLTKSGTHEELLIEECLEILYPVLTTYRRVISKFDGDKFDRAFSGDKKHSNDYFRLILSDEGSLQIIEVPRSDRSLLNARIAMQNSLALVFES